MRSLLLALGDKMKRSLTVREQAPQDIAALRKTHDDEKPASRDVDAVALFSGIRKRPFSTAIACISADEYLCWRLGAEDGQRRCRVALDPE